LIIERLIKFSDLR